MRPRLWSATMHEREGKTLHMFGCKRREQFWGYCVWKLFSHCFIFAHVHLTLWQNVLSFNWDTVSKPTQSIWSKVTLWPDSCFFQLQIILLPAPRLSVCPCLHVCLSWEEVLAWLQQIHTYNNNNTHIFVPACKFLGNIQSVAACITVRVQYQNAANDEYEVSENHQNNTSLN